MAQAMQEFQSKVLHDIDAARLRDALNMALLQMQTYWKVMKKKEDKAASIYSWPWFDLLNPEKNSPTYLASSMCGPGVQKDTLSKLFECLSGGNLQLSHNVITTEGCKGKVDSLGRTPLHYCAGVTGLQELVSVCVEHGCNINQQSLDGSTALHRAVYNQDPVVTKALLSANADPNIRDMMGRTASHWGSVSDNLDCLNLLITIGADLTLLDAKGHSTAMWACKNGKTDALKVVLASRQGPALARGKDEEGRVLLHLGANHPDIIELLLNTETATQVDYSGRNILHHAALNGRLDICRQIANIIPIIPLMVGDKSGKTPLHHAVMAGHSGVANNLLENEAEVSGKDGQGATVVDYVNMRQLHYCSVVLSAYLQADPTPPQQPVPVQPKKRPTSSRGRQPPAPQIIPKERSPERPEDKRHLSREPVQSKSSIKGTGITPGLLRHSAGQNPSHRLKDIPLAQSYPPPHQAPSAPLRPPSSRGNRPKPRPLAGANNRRPASPLPPGRVENLSDHALPPAPNMPPFNSSSIDVPLPWKLKDMPLRPKPPSRDNNFEKQNGSIDSIKSQKIESLPQQRNDIGPLSNDRNNSFPERPSNPLAHERSQNSLPHERQQNSLPHDREILENGHHERSTRSVAPHRIEQSNDYEDSENTWETVQPLNNGVSPRGGNSKGISPLSPRTALGSIGDNSSLLGSMPAIPGQSQGDEVQPVQPWYRKKLKPVPPNKMDILQSEPGGEEG